MLYISICDDDNIMAEKVKALIEKEMKKNHIEASCKVYENGAAFLNETEIYREELIFMDIEMPDVTGFDVAEKLKESGRNENLIFLTGYDHLVFDSWKCFPFYFIRKSEVEKELGQVLELFLKKQEEERKIFEYTAGNQSFHIPTEDIMYLTYWKHKIIITLQDGKKREFRGRIKECMGRLPSGQFFKANQGEIVNLKYCRELNENGFRMEDGELVQVSRERRREAKERFMKKWRRNYV